MRALLLLLTLLLTLSASGFSAGFAASGGDDCCGDDDEREAPPSERDAEDGGEGKGSDCPPFCHSCACAPLFEHPKPSAPRLVIWEPTFVSTFRLASEPPPGPPGPGVFHPPR